MVAGRVVALADPGDDDVSSRILLDGVAHAVCRTNEWHARTRAGVTEVAEILERGVGGRTLLLNLGRAQAAEAGAQGETGGMRPRQVVTPLLGKEEWASHELGAKRTILTLAAAVPARIAVLVYDVSRDVISRPRRKFNV
jgi:hypothetical protein